MGGETPSSELQWVGQRSLAELHPFGVPVRAEEGGLGLVDQEVWLIAS